MKNQFVKALLHNYAYQIFAYLTVVLIRAWTASGSCSTSFFAPELNTISQIYIPFAHVYTVSTSLHE